MGNTFIFRLILLCVVIFAFLIRIYGQNFDQGQHLHPDERFLTMVVSTTKLPSSIADYFNSKTSSFNPYNNKFDFYVYGTFPLLVTRFVGQVTGMTNYGNVFFVGRTLSAVFDSGTILLIYLISFALFKNRKTSILASFFYAIAVFPIQQAHFFTVDSFTVFFSTLTLYCFLLLFQRKNLYLAFLTGLSFGLTLANKTSLVVTLPFFAAGFFFLQWSLPKVHRKFLPYLFQSLVTLLLFLVGTFLTFRIFQPYAFDGLFTLSKHFIDNITEAHRMITGEIDYPPNIQWTNAPILVYPAMQIILWGLGPVIASLAGIGMGIALLKHRSRSLIALLSFFLLIFIYQGLAWAKYMRYFYPLYPILCICAGYGMYSLIHTLKKKSKIIGIGLSTLLILLSIAWPVAFLSIYERPHSRVAASAWIYQNIPQGAVLTSEEWDDGLPLPLEGRDPSVYTVESLALYNPESPQKWTKLDEQLKRADYVILSSNRLYGSIPKARSRYPQTTEYYQKLFSGKLGFTKLKEFTSYPRLAIGNWKLEINDSSSEESFTVYDHPKVIIFKKK